LLNRTTIIANGELRDLAAARALIAPSDRIVAADSGADFATYIGSAYPLFHMWDDHDYGANNADYRALWKGIALQAFKEYYPSPTLPNPEGGCGTPSAMPRRRY
jgi:hypothetical protein